VVRNDLGGVPKTFYNAVAYEICELYLDADVRFRSTGLMNDSMYLAVADGLYWVNHNYT